VTGFLPATPWIPTPAWTDPDFHWTFVTTGHFTHQRLAHLLTMALEVMDKTRIPHARLHSACSPTHTGWTMAWTCTPPPPPMPTPPPSRTSPHPIVLGCGLCVVRPTQNLVDYYATFWTTFAPGVPTLRSHHHLPYPPSGWLTFVGGNGVLYLAGPFPGSRCYF